MAIPTQSVVKSDKPRLLSLYRRMQTIRRCEEHLARATSGV